jgi:hypothetical protein
MVDMNDSMRASVRDLGLHEGDLDALSGHDRWVAKGARALSAKQPLSEREARALASEVRYQAQQQGVPARRAKSLRNAAEWLDSAAAQLVTYLDTSRIRGRHTDIDFNQAQPGDRIAIPGRAPGQVDVAEVMDSVKWYGVHKYTLKLDDGSTVDRYVGPSTPVRRLDPDVTTEQTPAELKIADRALDAGDNALALYDNSASDKNGPGAVTSWNEWFQHLAMFGDNFGPIPVSGLTIQKYKVENGIAWRSKGRSYLIELKPGESREEAKRRGDGIADLFDETLKMVPADMLRLQMGVAHLQGRNPSDTHWEKEYKIPGFTSAATGGNKSTTFWANTTPTPSTIRHEFSHAVDYHGVSGIFSVSRSSIPVGGQKRTWEGAGKADATSSRKFQARISETHRGHPLVLGQQGVTSYGMMSRPAEDFAEAARLWITDQAEGRIGVDRKTGKPVRFADVFPARALILDKVFGVATVDEGAAKRKGMTSARRIWMNELRRTGGMLFHSTLTFSEVSQRTGLSVSEVEQVLEQVRQKYYAEESAREKAPPPRFT